MKFLISAILLFASTLAHADTFGVHLASRHFPNLDRYNNANLGLYYKHDSGATVGFFRNSFDKNSFYLGYTAEYGPVAITVGGVTGYTGQTVKPMLVPSVALFTYQGITPRLAYIPKSEKGVAHVLHLMVDF